jgi:dihydrofolate synthase/folylpolyglutamate synthase
MTFREAVRHLNSRQMFGVKLGLDNITSLLQRLGNPEKSFKSIHIAGTNGKGSTAAIAASVFAAKGYRTGLYTSPHINTVRERISINGVMISHQKFAEQYEKIARYFDEIPCTYFECTTALAFLHFHEEKVDRAVIEAGLGGRHDATNVLVPVCSVITTIGYDHQRYLGNSLEEITGEKCGIIKKGIPVISGVTQIACREIVKNEAVLAGSALYETGTEVIVSGKRYFTNGTTFDARVHGTLLSNLWLSLPGTFQVDNARTALTAVSAAENFELEGISAAIRKGLGSAQWTDRFTVYNDQGPVIIVDVAHNEDGFRVLSENILKLFPGKNVLLIIGLKEDKNCRNVLKQILPLCTCGIGVPVRSSSRVGSRDQGIPVRKLRLVFNDHTIPFRVFPSVKAGVRYAYKMAGVNDIILCAGSHFTVHAFKKAIKSLD